MPNSNKQLKVSFTSLIRIIPNVSCTNNVLLHFESGQTEQSTHMDYPFDIRSELSQIDFVLKTQQQIIKDFGTAGINFPEGFRINALPFEQLLSAIPIRLKELNTSNSSVFSQLLYQIDLPENILPTLHETDDFYTNLAEVVLKREAYKVFLRSKYS